MARPLRIEYPGACYHVINRGNYRRNLFNGQGAAEAFVRTLGEAATQFGWRIHAYGTSLTRQVLTLDKMVGVAEVGGWPDHCASNIPELVIM